MTMTNSGGSVAAAAARGTLLTLVLRIFSFLSSQIIFRLVDVSSLGKASIELELLSSTVLFFSREGFRLALTKQTQANTPRLWNTAWCTVIVHTVLAAVAAGWWVLQPDSKSSNDDYRLAGLLYCLAAWMEGLAEPRVLWCLRTVNISIKASAEGIGALLKTIATIASLLCFPNFPVTAFGVGQVSHALGISIVMYLYTRKHVPLPTWKNGLDYETLRLTGIFTCQGIFKHLLTEGDRIVLSTLADNYHQGIYAIASAYGGMAARLLLQPLEENARLLWSRQNSALLQESYTVIVKAVLYIGAIFTFVAVNYTSVLVTIVGQPRDAAVVLSAFCVYTGVLAWNGMTEALVYAVSTSAAEIGQLSMAHTIVGGVFAGLAPSFVAHYSSVGLVAANGVCMGLRICYSIHFAAKYFKVGFMKLMRAMLPHPLVLVGFVVSYGVTRLSLGRLQAYESTLTSGTISLRNVDWLVHASQHVFLGILSLLLLLGVAMSLEQNFRRQLRNIFKERTD